MIRQVQPRRRRLSSMIVSGGGVEGAGRLVEHDDGRLDREGRARSRAAGAGRRSGSGRPPAEPRRTGPSRLRMTSSIAASRHASTTCCGGRVRSHIETFSPIVPLNRNTSWSTTPRELLVRVRGSSVRGVSSNSTSPLHGSYNPATSLATVDLPLPLPPTRATRSPGWMTRLKPSMRGGSSGLYPKLTSRSSTLPVSFTWAAASVASCSAAARVYCGSCG